MAAAPDLAALLEEKQRRMGQVTGGTRSVLAEPEETTAFEEFKRFTESILKGSAAGIINMAGGWGNVYDALKEDKTGPSPLSGVGIINAIAAAGGPDLKKIQGYEGAYKTGEAGSPAALFTTLGLPGLFGRTPKGIAGEFGVAGTTGLAAQTIAPDSPLAQLALQSTPYAVGGLLTAGQRRVARPQGDVPVDGAALLDVGRMTPGEFTGSRPQLATEARVEASPKIGERANVFRQAQAKDVEGFLTNLFNRATQSAGDVTTAANTAMSAFNNYGKSLSSKLATSARADFKAARSAGGKVDTTPVLSVIDEKLAAIPPEVAALDPLRNALTRIKEEYFIPGVEATTTPSSVLDVTGQPAFTTKTAATPAGAQAIDIDRLQKNLSAWGEAAYSGKADFGKGNIFEGVAPGQAKGISLAVLSGFRDALDNAIANNIPGADKLLKARDNFKANLVQIEEFANRPLAKYFDVPTASALTPEGIIDKLSKAKPTERAFLANVLQQHPEGSVVWDTVRRSQLDALLNKSRTAAAGAAEGSAQIDLTVLLKELNNKKGEFGYLIPDAAQQKDANTVIQYLQKIGKTAAETPASLRGDAYAVTRGVGGTAQAGLIVGELTSLARAILESPAAIANVVFNPATTQTMLRVKERGTVGRIEDASKAALGGALTAGQQVLRAGPRAGSSGDPTVENEATAAEAQNELKALLEEQALRQSQQQE
jgi:hypothetical protein